MGWIMFAIAATLFGLAGAAHHLRKRRPPASPPPTPRLLPWSEGANRAAARAIAGWRTVVAGGALSFLMVGTMMVMIGEKSGMTRFMVGTGLVALVLWVLSEGYFAGLSRATDPRVAPWYYALVAGWALAVPAAAALGVVAILDAAPPPPSNYVPTGTVTHSVTIVRTGPYETRSESTDDGRPGGEGFVVAALAVYGLIVSAAWIALLIIPLANSPRTPSEPSPAS